MTVFLSMEDLLQLVEDLGVGPVRDLGLLESAAHRPTTTVYGREVYDGLDLKAAVMMESLVRNHALVDGNKRLTWLAAVVFYGLNGVEVDAPDDDAYDFVVGMAAGEISAESARVKLSSWHD